MCQSRPDFNVISRDFMADDVVTLAVGRLPAAERRIPGGFPTLVPRIPINSPRHILHTAT